MIEPNRKPSGPNNWSEDAGSPRRRSTDQERETSDDGSQGASSQSEHELERDLEGQDRGSERHP